MKKDKKYKTGQLGKEINASNGKYILSLRPSADSQFPKSFDLRVEHVDSHFLEEMLNQDVTIYQDACHDFDDLYPNHGHMQVRNTTPEDIGYESSSGKFYVHFHQDFVFPDKDATIMQMPRTKHFPVPDTFYEKIKKLIFGK